MQRHEKTIHAAADELVAVAELALAERSRQIAREEELDFSVLMRAQNEARRRLNGEEV